MARRPSDGGREGPGPQRRHGGPRAAYEAGYRRHLAQHDDAVAALEDLARSQPRAILCMERRVEDCHRAILAQRLRADGFHVEEA